MHIYYACYARFYKSILNAYRFFECIICILQLYVVQLSNNKDLVVGDYYFVYLTLSFVCTCLSCQMLTTLIERVRILSVKFYNFPLFLFTPILVTCKPNGRLLERNTACKIVYQSLVQVLQGLHVTTCIVRLMLIGRNALPR